MKNDQAERVDTSEGRWGVESVMKLFYCKWVVYRELYSSVIHIVEYLYYYDD
jgi:hypothetical protein